MEGRNFLPGGPNSSRKKNFKPLFLRNLDEKKLKEKISEKDLGKKRAGKPPASLAACSVEPLILGQSRGASI